MEVFNTCFKDLVFTRVDEKQGYVIYGAGIATGLGGGHKEYVLLFVPVHLAFKNKARIYELPWQNLQTRNLSYSYRLKNQSWVLPRDVPNILFEIKQRDKGYSSYTSDGFPFELLLLHDPKKKTVYQYHNKIMLEAAISTFSAVFNYTGETPSPLHTFGPSVPFPTVQTEEVPPPQTSKFEGAVQIPSINNWFGAGGSQNSDDSFELL